MKSENNKSFSNDIAKLFEDVKEYLDLKYDIARLDITEKMVLIFTQFYSFFLFILIVPSIFLFFSFALSFYLGSLFDANYIGFLIVGLIYFLFAIFFFTLRKTLITKPLIKILSEMILKDD